MENQAENWEELHIIYLHNGKTSYVLKYAAILQLTARETRTVEGNVARARLILLLEDINDNSPSFKQQEYVVYVTEGRPPGTSIANITVRSLSPLLFVLLIDQEMMHYLHIMQHYTG